MEKLKDRSKFGRLPKEMLKQEWKLLKSARPSFTESSATTEEFIGELFRLVVLLIVCHSSH